MKKSLDTYDIFIYFQNKKENLLLLFQYVTKD